MNTDLHLGDMPDSVQPLVIGLIAVQAILMVIALWKLWRIKAEKIAGQTKLVWLLAILLGQAIGPIVFLYFAYRTNRERELTAQFESAHQRAQDNNHTRTADQQNLGQTIQKLYREDE